MQVHQAHLDERLDGRDDALGLDDLHADGTISLADDGDGAQGGHHLAVQLADGLDVPQRRRVSSHHDRVEELRDGGHHAVLLASAVLSVLAGVGVANVPDALPATLLCREAPERLEGLLQVASRERARQRHVSATQPLAGQHPLVRAEAFEDQLGETLHMLRHPRGRVAVQLLRHRPGDHARLVVARVLGHLGVGDMPQLLVVGVQEPHQRVVRAVVLDLGVGLEDDVFAQIDAEGGQYEACRHDREPFASAPIGTLGQVQDGQKLLPVHRVEDEILVHDDHATGLGGSDVVHVATGVDEDRSPWQQILVEVIGHLVDDRTTLGIELGHGRDGPQVLLMGAKQPSLGFRDLLVGRLAVSRSEGPAELFVLTAFVGESGASIALLRYMNSTIRVRHLYTVHLALHGSRVMVKGDNTVR